MKRARVVGFAVMAALLLAATAMSGYWLGKSPVGGQHAAAPAAQPSAARKVLYWYDPMYPDKRFDKAGKSPFMDMMLVPRYADEATAGADAAGGGSDTAGIRVDPRLAQNLGIRLARAQRGTLTRSVDTVGSVQADETRQISVQSRTAGWVEQLQVRAVNTRVQRGQVLAHIYSPELLAAQEEYLLLNARAHDDADRELAAAARQRLSLLGLAGAQIDALVRDGKARRALPVYAPADGIVSELGAREGAQVSPGMTLFNLLDLSVVWVMAEVPERQIAAVAVGARVEASLSAYPEERFEGTVDYVYPGVNSETRSVRVRTLLRNAGWKLKPGMVARVRVHSERAPEHVLVPAEALIRTGQRTVLIVAGEGGSFRPAQVRVGAESGGQVEILEGLTADEQVVVSGQFLIDSEANLRSAMDRLASAAPAARSPPATAAQAGTERTHYAQGVIESVDRGKREIVLAHGPFDSLGMPGMTMGFVAGTAAVLEAATPGKRVRFGIRRDAQGRFEIVELQAIDSATAEKRP